MSGEQGVKMDTKAVFVVLFCFVLLSQRQLKTQQQQRFSFNVFCCIKNLQAIFFVQLGTL